MPSFAYSAINAQGNVLSGEIQATDLGSARDALRGDGLLAQSIEERRLGGSRRRHRSQGAVRAGDKASSRSRCRSSRGSSRR